MRTLCDSGKGTFMKTQLFFMLISLTLAGPAGAEIYRWVDAQGRVHYSDRPVEGAKRVSDVESRPSDPEEIAERNAAAQEARQKAADEALKKQTDQTAAANVEKDMAKLQAERCKEAQEAYRTATESQRLYRIGKDGEREYLTAEEITAARINSRKLLDEACKQPK
jgi:hypothetical protein